MNLEEQYHAEGMLRKIERVEAERDNAWTELREIREAISANPEESTLDEVVKLRQQLAAAQTEVADLKKQLSERDAAIAKLNSNLRTSRWERNEPELLEEIDELRQQLAAFHSAVEHVTEDGCTRRSFVAMPEGWAMVHKDRLHALELAEEQLAATDGLDQYILCEKEPVVWMQSDHLSRFVHHACGAQSALVRCSDHQLMPDFQPLYRAMKVRVAREKNAKNC